MTNAERQKKFRDKQKAEGRNRKVIWTDKGFVAPAKTSMTKKDFDKELKKILANFSEKGQGVFLAEVFEYAKQATKVCSRIYTYTKESEAIKPVKFK